MNYNWLGKENNVLLHNDLGSALGEESVSTTFPRNDSRHALPNAIERVHPCEGFLRLIVSYRLIVHAQGYYESK